MPSFIADQVLRSFAVRFVVRKEGSLDAFVILLVRTAAGSLRWRSAGAADMSALADAMEKTARTVRFDGTPAELGLRRSQFDADVEQLMAVSFPNDGSARAVTNFRLGKLPGALVLDLFLGEELEQYLVDAACAAKLIVEIRDAVADPDNIDGAETVH